YESCSMMAQRPSGNADSNLRAIVVFPEPVPPATPMTSGFTAAHHKGLGSPPKGATVSAVVEKEAVMSSNAAVRPTITPAPRPARDLQPVYRSMPAMCPAPVAETPRREACRYPVGTADGREEWRSPAWSQASSRVRNIALGLRELGL